MADIMIAHGKSTSGTRHSLEVQPQPTYFKFTVMGPTGKRHASVKLSRKDVRRIIMHLSAAIDED